MKKLYTLNNLSKQVMHWLGAILVLFLMTGIFSANAQVIKTFAPRTALYKIKGDFTMIGNSNLTLQNYAADENNSNNVMVFNDIDGDASTFNSSSANLTFSTENGAIASCSNILFAGLYWSGRSDLNGDVFNVTKGAVTKSFNKRQVKIKGPGDAAYTTIDPVAADRIYYPTSTEGGMFAGFTDITNFVKARGVGTYTVADMALLEGNGGSTGYYGGWTIVVVYENYLMKWRNVTVTDGYAYVIGGEASHELPISGFEAVQTGQVNVKVGLMAGEGDVGISGDYFEIRNAANSAWVRLNHSGNTTGNFFNSSVQTGGNTRNPSLTNNTGLDVAMWNLNNTGNTLIANSATSTRFRYGSSQDTYIIFNVAFSVDAYIPEVQNILATVGPTPASVLPGEDIPFNVDLRNFGTEAVSNYKLTIPIPGHATFVPGSLGKTFSYAPAPTSPPNNLYFDANLGPTGSIVYEYGTLPLSSSVGKLTTEVLGSITFKLKSTTNCILLRNEVCAPIVVANGISSGTGAVSGTVFNNLPFVTGIGGGACAGTPTTAPISIPIDATAYIAANCNNANDWGPNGVRIFNICPSVPATTVEFSAIASSFPANTRFFKLANGTGPEYTSSNSFPAVNGSSLYWAAVPGAGACTLPFRINLCAIPQGVTGLVWIDKNGNRTKDAEEGFFAANTYKVVAFANNGLEPNKVMGSTLVGADGTYTLIVAGNPVFNVDNTVSNPSYTLDLMLASAAPADGSIPPAIPSNSAMGAAPITSTAYYVTNPSDAQPLAGSFNVAGILPNLPVAAPWTAMTNMNIGVQSAPIADPKPGNSLPKQKGGTFFQLSIGGEDLSGFDAEETALGTGHTFRITSNPTVQAAAPVAPLAYPIVIKLAYDFDGLPGTPPTILDASADANDGSFVDIVNYQPERLYVFYESGSGTYNGFFTYSSIDDANAVSAPVPYSFDVVLPITGIQLAGTYNNAKANLQWTATAVDDVDRFEIERGNNSNGFTKVATLGVNGLNYKMADDLANFNGNEVFYRIKVIRKNGTISYSNVIILKMATITGLQVMPTLVQANVQVRFKNTRSQQVSVKVMNAAGQTVMTYNTQLGIGNATINLNGFEKLPNGNYNVQVFADNAVQQAKIVVQH